MQMTKRDKLQPSAAGAREPSVLLGCGRAGQYGRMETEPLLDAFSRPEDLWVRCRAWKGLAPTEEEVVLHEIGCGQFGPSREYPHPGGLPNEDGAPKAAPMLSLEYPRV
jgi:hypothetical protein